jgi:chorismate dehydratase
MIKLGHIVYSNCFPPHAGIILKMIPFPFTIVNGIPTQLNRMLAEGGIDVSPSSSIEYAVHRKNYLLMPDLSITSRTRVMSILLESNVPITALDGKIVAMTTASATSVVLLRILLEILSQVKPRYITYEQGVEDPLRRADARLTIGDLAIQRSLQPTCPFNYDLGSLWNEFTGLPFVFALWQINYRKPIHNDLERLYDMLMESKAYGTARLRELADENNDRFGIPSDVLHTYWQLFSYDFTEAEKKGLMAFYRYAADLGVIDQISDLSFWTRR